MTQVQVVLVAAGAVGGALGLLILTAWRPALGCALLAVAIPLTGGISRGSVVPFLRLNEALLLVVVGGVLVHELPRRRPLPFSGLDIVVLAYCLGGVLIPWAVLALTHADVDQDTWRAVVAPVQYLLVYLLFSRVEFSERELRLTLNLTFAASAVVGLVAVAEVVSVPGVRQFILAYYPPPPPTPGDTLYRPTSLLGHFSAVGAFGLLNFLLALALAAARDRGFPSLWLGLVMGVNVAAALATQTWAPLLALPVAIVVVVLCTKHVPWQLGLAPVALLAAVVAFWPSVQARIQAQLSGGGGRGSTPETLQTRITYWQDYFVPSLLQHQAWLGTGTVIPSEVPRPLVNFVDNGYLFMAFRAGLPGLFLILAVLVAILVVGWGLRTSQQPTAVALGAICVAAVVAVALLETTSEYLTFTSVTQEFWMLVGLAAAAARRERAPAAAPDFVRMRAPSSRRLLRESLPVRR